MLKKITATSPELTAFVEKLQLPLSEAQQDHAKQITDALITIDGDKNLSNLYRHIVDDPCPKSAADTFREAPWKADDIREPLRTHHSLGTGLWSALWRVFSPKTIRNEPTVTHRARYGDQ